MLSLADLATTLPHLQASAAASTGTPGWITALIAAAAAILAATVTALSSAYVARRKVAEIQLSNALQLASQYLESARQYTQNVYLPIAVAVHNLHTSFLRFKAVTDESKLPAAEQGFSKAIDAFLAVTDAQFKTGASAVLTFKLDDTLTGFTAFVEKSQSATGPVKINEVELALAIGMSGLRIEKKLIHEFSSSISPYAGFDFRTFGISVEFQQNLVLVAAPLTSDDFAKRFILDVNQIKSAIKEVTLGTYNAPSST
jgi:hypothetical protein